jgi:aldehyde dehydrogenase (NAD+)
MLVSQENGMPIGLSSAFNGAAPVGLLQMYAELIKVLPLEEVRPSQSGATIVRREPVGVVGAIRAVELPPGAGDDEDRARAGGRLHDRAQAVA